MKNVVKTTKKILLLDLNYTLVSNSKETMRLFTEAVLDYLVDQERYYQWLIDWMKAEQRNGLIVAMITARTNDFEAATLDHLRITSDFSPNYAYFKPVEQKLNTSYRADRWKKMVMDDYIFPMFGQDNDAHYLALESNEQTRTMYAREGIHAMRRPDTAGCSMPFYPIKLPF